MPGAPFVDENIGGIRQTEENALYKNTHHNGTGAEVLSEDYRQTSDQNRGDNGLTHQGLLLMRAQIECLAIDDVVEYRVDEHDRDDPGRKQTRCKMLE